MGPFLIYMLLMIGFIVLLFRFIMSYTNTVVRQVVERKHQDTEAITFSGCAPPEWKKKLAVRSGNEGLAKLYAMRRIRRLINYFGHTPLVEDEDTRKEVVDTLKGIQEGWRNARWREIFPYE